MEARERVAINNNNPPQPSQVSPPVFSYIALNSSRNENPNQLIHQRNNYSRLQEEQMGVYGERRELDPDPDPPEPVSETQPPSPPPPPPPPPPPTLEVVVRYRECLKNHAANMGSHVVDGCGEFMPNGEEGTPESLKCAACECHRSFHRREMDGESTTTRPPPTHNPPATMQPPQHHLIHHHRHPPPIMVAFGGNNNSVVAPTESSSEDLDIYRRHVARHVMDRSSLQKKRFRTKFTEEQKEKMHEFAEKIGWKIQKQDEHEIREFCNEVELKRNVFKVWMHNSKQAMKKKQP